MAQRAELVIAGLSSNSAASDDDDDASDPEGATVGTSAFSTESEFGSGGGTSGTGSSSGSGGTSSSSGTSSTAGSSGSGGTGSTVGSGGTSGTGSTSGTSSTGSTSSTSGTNNTAFTLIDGVVPLPMRIGIQDTELLEDHTAPVLRVRIKANQDAGGMEVAYEVQVPTQAIPERNAELATRDTDYLLADGTVTFPADSDEVWIDMPQLTIGGDTELEHLEYFDIKLLGVVQGSTIDEGPIVDVNKPFIAPMTPDEEKRNPDGTLIDRIGTVWIADDDSGAPPPWIDVFVSNQAAWEGQPIDFTITLSEPATHELRLDYQTVDGTATAANGDYLPIAGQWVIPAGELQATYTVDTVDDAASEGTESFQLELSNPWWNRTVVGVAMLRDDESEIRIVQTENISADEGETKDHLLGEFHHSDAQPGSHHDVTIAWGDGSTSAGSLVQLQNGEYQIFGNHTYIDNRSYSVQVTIDDQLSTASASFSVSAVVANVAPTASSSSYTVSHNQILDVSAVGVLSGVQEPGDDIVSAIKVSDPLHGSLRLNRDGSFHYDPVDSFIGTDTFLFKPRDSDGAFGALATVTINVTNDAPIAVDDTDTMVAHDRSAVLEIVDNDTDQDQDRLTPVIVSGPTSGSLTVREDGTVLYTPVTGYVGSDTFTYKADDGLTTSNVAVVQLTVTNTTPVPIDGTISINEDAPYVFGLNAFSWNDAEEDALDSIRLDSLPQSGTLTRGGIAAQLGDIITAAEILAGDLVFTPGANEYGAGYAQFSFSIDDGIALSNTDATITIDVTAVNDLPVVASANVVIDEDQTYPFAASEFPYTDPDGDPLQQLIIMALPTAGILALDGNPVELNQSIAAADIDAGLLTFTGDANKHGTGYAGFRFTASDGIQSSATSATLTIDITSIADAPFASAQTVTTNEDQSYTFAAGDFPFQDADGDSLAAVSIRSLPTVGMLELSGIAVVVDQQISATALDSGNLQFIPVANQSGSNYASFQFDVSDGLLGSETPATITIDVVATDDVPSAGNSTVTFDEDQTYTFVVTDFPHEDLDGDDPTAIRIDSLPARGTVLLGGSTVSANDEISVAQLAAGDLTFVPAMDENGPAYSSFTFSVSDGTSFSLVSGLVTIDVIAVNDLAIASNRTIAINEDFTYTLGSTDFPFVDVDQDSLASVKIIRLPSAGTLSLAGVTVTPNEVISVADLDAGNLTFTPASNEHALDYSRIDFAVNDGVELSPYWASVRFDVASVNDLPAGVASSVTGGESQSYVFLSSDFAFEDAEGDQLKAIKIHALPRNGLLSQRGVPVTLNQEVTLSELNSGELVFTPAGDEFGDAYAHFDFLVRDWMAYGTVAGKMIIDIIENSPPVAQDNTVAVDEDATYSFAAADFPLSDVEGGSLAAIRIESLPGRGTLSLDDNTAKIGDLVSLTQLQTGALKYVAEPDENGAGYASFGFSVSEGIDFSTGSATLFIDVNPLNDPATPLAGEVIVSEDQLFTFSPDDFAFEDVDGDPLISVKIASLPAAGSLTVNGNAAAIGQEITLSEFVGVSLQYLAATDENGQNYASFDFQVDDGGGVSAGSATIDIHVIAVNDAPTTVSTVVSTDEDQPYVFSGADFVFQDVDAGDALALITVGSLPDRGTLLLDSAPVTIGQQIGIASLNGGELTFLPDADENGFGYAQFDFSVSDGLLSSANVAAITIDVTPVNDSLTVADNTIEVQEDNSYVLKPSKFPFQDADNSVFSSIKINSLPDRGSLTLGGISVSVGQAVSLAELIAGDLVFTPNLNEHGVAYTSFQFQASDGVGYSTNTAVITFDVTAVNDLPMAGDGRIRAYEDLTYTLVPADFPIDDVDGGDSLDAVRITALPAKGSLEVDGVAVVVNQEVSVADLNAGKLTYTPVVDERGYAYTDFQFQVSDGIGYSVNAATMIVDVPLPSFRNTSRTIREDFVSTHRLSDFLLNGRSRDDTVGALVFDMFGGVMKLDGVPVSDQTFISGRQIYDDRVTWHSDPDLFGEDVAGFRFDWVADGVTYAWALQHLIDITAVSDRPTADTGIISLDEDQPHTFQWSDLGIHDGDPEQPDTIRLTTVPTLGTLLIEGVAATVGDSLTESQFDEQVVRYIPGQDDSGVGSDSIEFIILDPEGLDSDPQTLNIDINAVTAQGTWRLDVRDSTGALTTSADIGQNVTVEVVGTSEAFFSSFRGGYVDVSYDPSLLQLQSSVQYTTHFDDGAGFEFYVPGLIGNLGSYNYDSPPQGATSVLASVTFQVIGEGDAKLQILPPSNPSFDLFLNHGDDGFTASQVDYVATSFIGASGAMASSSYSNAGPYVYPIDAGHRLLFLGPEVQPNGPEPQLLEDPPEDPYEFVDRPIVGTFRDTTPREATEPNAVFRPTPEQEQSPNPNMEFRSDDVAYYRIALVLDAETPSSPVIKVSGAEKDLYDFIEPTEGTDLIAALFGQEESLGDNETWYYPVINAGSSHLDFDLGRGKNGNEADIVNPTELSLEIVYKHGPGDYRSTPPNPATSAGKSTETAIIDDPEEVLSLESEDAVEYDARQSPPGPKDGLIQVNLQPTSPVIPSGLADQLEIAPYSQQNYLHTDIRLILEVLSDGSDGVAVKYATPIEDFGLGMRRVGDQYVGSSQIEVSSPPAEADPLPLYIKEVFGLPGAKAGYRYWNVSDDDETDWITVSAVWNEFDSSMTLWDQIDIIVTPVSDNLPEGSETFTAYLETRVTPEPGKSTQKPELTTFINYDEVKVAIDDAITDDAETERDGLCNCTCNTCAGAGLPVNMYDGSVAIHPLDGSPDSPSAIGPSYHSPGAASTQGTLRTSFPFKEIFGGGALPQSFERIDIALQVQGGALVAAADGRESVLADIGLEDFSGADPSSPVPERHEFSLQLPPNYGGGADEDSIAVRLPTIVNTTTGGGIDATKTGAYRAKITADARDDENRVMGTWNGKSTVLVNNLQEDFHLAPGWSFPFEHQLIVGTIGGGEVGKPEDWGAALFRGDQTASWFNTEALIAPPEVFSQLRPSSQGYELVEPDGSKQIFGASGRSTSTPYQTAFIMTEGHDSAGNVTRYAYDTSGRVTSITDPLGRQTTFDWSAFTPPSDPINDGSTVENHLRITDWRGRTTSYEYHVFPDQRTPYLVIRHAEPDEGASLNPTDNLIEIFRYDSQGYVTSVRRSSHATPSAFDPYNQTTTISYKSVLHSDSSIAVNTLRRVSVINHPDGSNFTLNHVGIQDALVGGDQLTWRRDFEWNSLPNALNRADIMGPFWVDEWIAKRSPGSQSVPDGTIDGIDPSIFVASPKRDLRSFDNYAAYTLNDNDPEAGGDPEELGGEPPRRYEFTLDRRGRISAMEDPQGNVTQYERQVVYRGGQTGASDMVAFDRGEVLKVTAPDPDVLLNENQNTVIANGPLAAPVTTYEYEAGTPFVSKTTLPDTQSAGLPGGQTDLVIQNMDFVHGQPKTITDELGLTTYVDRDTFGVPQRIYVSSTPDPTLWVNSLDRYNVNGDQSVSALDALQIINQLGIQPGPPDVTPPRPPQSGKFYDVNGDGTVSALDALQVINELARSDGARVSSLETRATELVYVNTDRYNEFAVQLATQTETVIESVDEATFKTRTLLGAEIIQTGRSKTGDRIAFYSYYLASPALPYHGQVKAIYETSYSPIDGSLDFAGASVTRFDYDPSDGYLRAVTDPVGRTTEYRFDDLGRLLKIITPDPDGNDDPATTNVVENPLSPTRYQYSYDVFGNLFQEQVEGDTFNTFADAATAIQQTALTSYSYDKMNRLTVIAEPHPLLNLTASQEQPAAVAQVTSFIGHLQTPLDDLRPITRLQYNRFNELTIIQNAEQETFTYTYDLLSRVLSESSPQVDVFSWSPVGGASIESKSLQTRYSYYTSGNMHSLVDAENLESVWSYDGWNRPLSNQLRRPFDLHKTTWSYAVVGVEGTPKLWQSVRSDFSDSGSQLLTGSSIVVDSFGRIVRQDKLLEDSVSPNQFDPDNDLTASMEFRYFADDLPDSITDPRGNNTRFQYDHLGRTTKVIGAAVAKDLDYDTPGSGITHQTERSFQYDLAHQLSRVIDPSGVITDYTYDHLGNVDRVNVYSDSDPNDLVITPGSVVERMDYDFDGFSRLVHDIHGRRNGSTGISFVIASTFYDQLGRVAERREGTGTESAATVYDYDRVHRLSHLTDPGGNVTDWAYDDVGRVSQETIRIGTQANPVEVSRQFYYDAVNNVTQSRDRNGRLIRYAYDDFHQPETERWYAPAANPNDPTNAGALLGGVDYAFDSLGRLESVGDSSTDIPTTHRYDFRYDQGSRLVAELQSFTGSWTGGDQTIGLERDYDHYDNLVETRAFRDAAFSLDEQSILSSDSDYVDTRAYDAQNRLESISRAANASQGISALHVTFGYDEAGRVTRTNRYHGSDTSSGVVWNTVLVYDDAGRIETITHSDPIDDLNPLSVYETEFTESGVLTSSVVRLGTTEHLRKAYAYDNRGQLTSEYEVGLTAEQSTVHTSSVYFTDAAGNRSEEGLLTRTTNTIERDNRLVADARWTYTYDNEGNVTSKRSVDGKTLWQYEWDHRNRLIEVVLRFDVSGNVSETSGVVRTVTHTYDGLDRWIGSENSQTGENRLFVHDAGQISLEFVEGDIGDRYLWAAGVDQLLARDGAGVGEDPEWTLTDHLGSVRDIVSETASISHTDYDAFGNVEGVPEDLLFGYTARPYDPGSEQQNNHHRWYDAASGRWLSQDPIGFAAADANLYRYVGNQPTATTDPYGLEPPTVSPKTAKPPRKQPTRLPGVPNPNQGGTIIQRNGRIQFPKNTLVLGSNRSVDFDVESIVWCNKQDVIALDSGREEEFMLSIGAQPDGSIPALVIVGHGSATGGVVYTRNGRVRNFSEGGFDRNGREKEFNDLIKRKLAPNARIYILGCDQASVAFTNLQEMANETGHPVIGNKGPVTFGEGPINYYWYGNGDWIEFPPGEEPKIVK